MSDPIDYLGEPSQADWEVMPSRAAVRSPSAGSGLAGSASDWPIRLSKWLNAEYADRFFSSDGKLVELNPTSGRLEEPSAQDIWCRVPAAHKPKGADGHSWAWREVAVLRVHADALFPEVRGVRHLPFVTPDRLEICRRPGYYADSKLVISYPEGAQVVPEILDGEEAAPALRGLTELLGRAGRAGVATMLGAVAQDFVDTAFDRSEPAEFVGPERPMNLSHAVMLDSLAFGRRPVLGEVRRGEARLRSIQGRVPLNGLYGIEPAERTLLRHLVDEVLKTRMYLIGAVLHAVQTWRAGARWKNVPPEVHKRDLAATLIDIVLCGVPGSLDQSPQSCAPHRTPEEESWDRLQRIWPPGDPYIGPAVPHSTTEIRRLAEKSGATWLLFDRYMDPTRQLHRYLMKMATTKRTVAGIRVLNDQANWPRRFSTTSTP